MSDRENLGFPPPGMEEILDRIFGRKGRDPTLRTRMLSILSALCAEADPGESLTLFLSVDREGVKFTFSGNAPELGGFSGEISYKPPKATVSGHAES